MSDSSTPPRRTWRLWGIEFDVRITQIVVISTLALLLDFYNQILPAEYDRVIFSFAIPAILIVVVWREDLREYGLRLGDWRVGLPIALAAMVVMGVLLWFLGRTGDFTGFYARFTDRPAWRIVVDVGVEQFAWEFFFRGWLLFALARKYGTDALWLQAVPFALMHLLKPELETLSTIFGGFLFALLAWRTRSCLYGWLIHWFQAAWLLLIVAGYV